MLHPTCVFANSPEVLHPQEPEATEGKGSQGTRSLGEVGVRDGVG